MTRTIRKLFAKILTAGAIAAPFAVPAVAHAQVRFPAEPAPAAEPATPAKREMNPKELHQYLARGAGWIQITYTDGTVRHGTGGIIDLEKKLMITNDHVVDGSDVVEVVFPMWKNGKLVTDEAAYNDAPRVKAVVIDRDANRDLALIKLDSVPAGAHAFPLAAEEPEEGDDIQMIGGYTRGGDGLVWGAVKGTVRASGPQPLGPGRNRRQVPVREVLSDARGNKGNSGSVVVNTVGELVAVNYAFKPWAMNVARHVSVVEVKAFLKVAMPLSDPKTAEQFLARAKRRLDTGRYAWAAADASAALAKNPKLAEAYHVRGSVFLAKDDAQTALEDLNDALKLEPQNYEFRVSRGLAHRELGKTAEAIADFTAAVRIDPTGSEAYNERALTNFHAKKFAEAEADFNRAIDADPEDHVLWGNRGDAREKQEKFKDAVSDYLQAAKLAKWEPDYPNRVGAIMVRHGKFEAAAEAFGMAVDATGGTEPLYWGNMADALRRAGKSEAAVKCFTKAVEAWKEIEKDPEARVDPLGPGNDYAGRAVARIALKQYQEAVDDLTKAIDVTGRKVGWYFAERARAFELLGQKVAASVDREAAEKLGHKAEKPVAEAKPVAPAAQGKQPAAVVGTWAGAYVRNNEKMAQVIKLNADGSFEAVVAVSGPGGTKELSDTGTWSATDKQLTLNGKATGTVVRNYKWVGNNVEIEITELGIAMQYGKVK